ncbi:MAG TPA: hypothetical protein VFP65_07780 [Anaeromyxobacteraceae bacterium]|nr:hypothetical protein [Anaeromyxobacteraceae bacterium]
MTPRTAKIAPPRISAAVVREKTFGLLDRAREHAAVWISGPAGAGKTTLVASYLRARRLRSLWYQLDQGDRDLASFFYHLGEAARRMAPDDGHPLPLLTPEYLSGVPTFTRRFLEELFDRLTPPTSSCSTITRRCRPARRCTTC